MRHPPHPTVAPPPPPPTQPSTPSAVLEIGSPMAVTINGVTVSPQASKVPESYPRQPSGFLVPAKPAIAHEDIPDSMGHHSLTSNKPPPPLPMSPPPNDDDDEFD